MLRKLAALLTGEMPAGPRVGSAGLPLGERVPKLALISFVILAAVLAGRALHTAPDDMANLVTFDGGGRREAAGWWLYWLEEPLWRSYTLSSGGILGPEWAMRATIFAGALAFLCAGSKLSQGGWKASILVLFVFVVDSTLATQMYYNQIRQGFAMSIFMTTAALGGGPVLGAVLASGVHSSFLVLLPCAIAARLAAKRDLFFIASLGAVVLVGYLFQKSVAGLDLDLGRRSDTYELAGKLNVNYYVMALVQYSLLVYLGRRELAQDVGQLWFRMTIIHSAAALALAAVHEAGGRLMYISNGLVLLFLAQNIRKRRILVAAVAWSAILVFQVVNEAYKLNFDRDSWFGRWALILP